MYDNISHSSHFLFYIATFIVYRIFPNAFEYYLHELYVMCSFPFRAICYHRIFVNRILFRPKQNKLPVHLIFQ